MASDLENTKDEFTDLQNELRALDTRRSEILKRLVKLQDSQTQNASPIGTPTHPTAVQTQQEKVELFLV